MRINADFSLRASVAVDEGAYVRSPEPGVERLMLDRIGDEIARATSIVRYAAGSRFAEHGHALGEEFLVLGGVFSDEHADYPAGTYVRNPPGTRHSPLSREGCRILVKLRQFDARDLTPVVVDTRAAKAWQSLANGGAILPLHTHGSEQVAMLKLPAGTSVTLAAPAGGLECLLVDGILSVDGKSLTAEHWLRLPPGDAVEAAAVDDCLVWRKTGHLPA